MCTKIDKIQRNINTAFNDSIHLWGNIIRAYRRHPALAAIQTNPTNDTSDMVNSLCSSIINYEVVNKPIATGNLVQSDNNEEDDEMFFTDHQYRRDGPMRSRYRDANTLSSRLSYRPKTFKCIKKCFVCRKISCWSTNHIQQNRDDSKKKFGDCHPKYKARPG